MNLLGSCFVILLSVVASSSEKMITKNIDVDDIRDKCPASCTIYVAFCVSSVTELCSYERVDTFTWKVEVSKRSIQLTFSYDATQERILRLQLAQPRYSNLYFMKESEPLKQMNLSLEQDTERENDELKTRMDQLEERLEFTLQEFNNTKEELNLSNQKINNTEDEMNNLNKELNSRKEEMNKANQEVNNMKEALNFTKEELRKTKEDFAIHVKNHQEDISFLKVKLELILRNEKSKHQKYEAAVADLLMQIEQENTRKQEQTSNVQKQLELLHTKIQTFKDDVIRAIAPFPSPPTTEMINTQRSFKYLGMSPLLCNEFGYYPLIDWRTLKQFDWTRQWNMMRTKKSDDEKNDPVSLLLPPLLLPADLGGWMMDFFLKWNGEFRLYGGLYSEDHNKDAPLPLKVPMSLKIKINENVTFSKQQTFTFETAKKNAKGLIIYDILWPISADMEQNWTMPTMSVRVEKQ